MIGNQAFIRLRLPQFASAVAVYGLNYAAVMQMEQVTHSSARTGLVIVTSILPAFLASLLAGAAVDRRDRVGVLLACHLARAPVALAFWPVVRWLPPEPALAALLAINASLAALSQFAAPAELALLPDLVSKERLMTANAWLQVSTLAAEGAGIVLLGPLLFRMGRLPLMSVLGVGLYLLALVIVPARTLRQERPPAEARGRVMAVKQTLSNAAAVLPMPFGGALADLLGIRPVLFLVTLVMLGTSATSNRYRPV